MNEKPSLVYKVPAYAAAIPPQSVAGAGNPLGGWADASLMKWGKILSLAGAGGGTFSLKVEQATSSGGAGVKDLLSAASLGITAQAAASVVQVDVALDEGLLDVTNSYRWVRLNVTCTGGGGTLYAATLELGPQVFTA
ncbi:MAG: hypothetical protein ACLPJH_11210 [Myxococcaceae bacterium]